MINLEYLTKTFPGDIQIINTVIDVFKIEYPKFVEEFKSLVISKELEKLKKLAHRWQYTAKILGALELRKDFQKLEAYEHLTDIEIDKLSIKILDQMANTFLELKKYETVP